jgi:pimeloyl-ACP methyl ester carboxylesterase
MNIDQFIADTRELTLHLLKRFQKDRLVLVGHSWGSLPTSSADRVRASERTAAFVAE